MEREEERGRREGGKGKERRRKGGEDMSVARGEHWGMPPPPRILVRKKGGRKGEKGEKGEEKGEREEKRGRRERGKREGRRMKGGGENGEGGEDMSVRHEWRMSPPHEFRRKGDGIGEAEKQGGK